MSPTANHTKLEDDFDLEPATPAQLKRGGGPKTDEGKARSSQNGRSHGCCSNTLILSGEDPEEYEQIKEGWFTDYNPGSFAPLTLVLNVVKAQWFMLRNQRRCSEFEISLAEKSPIDWTDKDHRNLTNFMRYRTAAELIFNRCFNDLEKYRSTRVREHHSAERIRLKGLEYAAKIERDWLKKGATVQEPKPECPAEAPKPSTVADPPRPAKSAEPIREPIRESSEAASHVTFELLARGHDLNSVRLVRDSVFSK